ncbi:MAG: H-NS histone family protein [Achromobacter sp.]|uniref:H-NS histone family protein n=1 Tax=unclassified Achromobacter TaxID=2626865 RepID=UPI0018D032FB|nr:MULTISPECIES: H-NS histone family protein [unclassified Achromobacter]MBN9642856.1 H-NS histone family protein [Achromobacter sp.]
MAIDELNRQINAVDAQLDKLLEDRRAEEIREIVRSMHSYSISPKEISAAFINSRPEKKEATEPRPRQRPPVPPKYRHPDTGETWTGRGRAPRWLTAQERAGVDRNDFLILKDLQ